jgi:hypothetical protein
MPTPVNLIDSLQQKYDALASFTGKPANLWFGDIWPTKAGGAVDYPFIRFLHTGTPTDTDFEYNALEEWGFRFEIYAQTAQQATTIFDRVRFDGLDPNVDPSTPRTGFWYPTTVDVPAGYVFKSLEPVGQFTLEVRSGQFSPSGTPIHVLTFDMRFQAHRVTFS